MTVRTRFAPSPTGYLHIGGVRTALFNWLLAKQAGGQFILRIDDTDAKRNVAEALQPILDGFRWLGIDWDEGPTDDGADSVGPQGPYFQSQRLERYQQAAIQLLESGLAYRDYSGADFVKEREAAEKAKTNFVYSRNWMAESDEQAAAFEAEGRTAVVRLKMPREGKCEFTDLIRGEQSYDWELEPDHVIQRADGTCLYHLANVVDDHDFQITHVVRAVEHLSNTPRQIFIAQSLGYQLPQYAHLPYVAEPGSKKKLSKRNIDKYLHNKDFKRLYQAGVAIGERIGIQPDPSTFNPVLVDFYRDIGFLPDAVVNYLLLLGWSLDDKTEFFSKDEMLQQFSLERVVKAAASFDAQKLTAFQQHYMDQLPVKQKVNRCLKFLQSADLASTPPDCDLGTYLQTIIVAAGDRICMAGDILKFDFFFVDDEKLVFEEKPFQKRMVKPEGAGELLSQFADALQNLPDDQCDAEQLEAFVNTFCESASIGLGDIIHALRVATTGKAAGFGMFETMAILGKQRCLNRIGLALTKLQTIVAN
ncbi:MAG: glutamate--tRNA ligase [Planctomycetota bacterium]